MERDSQFSVEKVHLQFDLFNLQWLKVSNNILYLVLETNLIYKINLDNPALIKQYYLQVDGAKITQLWLHPNGYHLVIEVNHKQYYYLNEDYDNFKPLTRFKGLQVREIGFGSIGSGRSRTGEFLVVTKAGVVFIGSISANKEVFKKDEKLSKEVFRVEGGDGGVELGNDKIEMIDNGKLMSWETNESLAASFKKKPKIEEIGSGVSLSLYQSNGSIFAYIYQASEEIKIYSNNPHLRGVKLESTQFPTSFIITKYHLIVQYNDEFVIINQLNNQVVFHKHLQLGKTERILRLSGDYVSNTFWISTNFNIYEIVLTDESKDIWRIFLDSRLYDEALKSTVNKSNRNLILLRKGRELWKNEQYLDSVKILAKTTEPFESICLDLMNLDRYDELLQYLLEKFSGLDSNKMQLIMVSSWIVELFIERLNHLEDLLGGISNNPQNVKLGFNSDRPRHSYEDVSTTKLQLETNLEKFLISNKEHLDKQTIYQLLISFNKNNQLLFFAKLINDDQFILDYWINLNQWDEAIKIIVTMYNEDNSNDILYKYSTVLLVNYSKETVSTWLRFPQLEYVKLLPSLLTYNKNNNQIRFVENQAIRFLANLIYDKKNSEKIIHNTYLSILITYPNTDEMVLNGEILKLLKSPIANYDPDFILRLCLRRKLIQPSIHILLELNLYENALILALENDLLETSEFIINKLDNSLEFEDAIQLNDENYNKRKKLWLLFAKFLIDRVSCGDIKDTNVDAIPFNDSNDSAINIVINSTLSASSPSSPSSSEPLNNVLKYLLNKSQNLLSLKDLLPLFPNFVVINNFKNEIITSLNNYNVKINQLSNEMTESLKTSNKIKTDFVKYEKRFQIIEPGESCDLCDELLISKSFIKFPCLHGFHKDCLIKHYLEFGDYKVKLFFQNFKKNKKNKESEKSEIDEILSKSCLLCNDVKINSLDEGFIDEASKEMVEWEL